MTKIMEENSKEYLKMLQSKFRQMMRQASLESLASIDTTAEESPEAQEVLEKIKNGDFEVNNIEGFLESLHKSSRMEFLTDYTKKQLEEQFTTYKVNGYDCGFAIKNDGDIVSVHNNTGIKGGGIGDALIEAAKERGGTKLDHYAGFLDSLYQKHDFEEYDRYTWDDEYASPTWDYTKYGRPDVVLRRLKNK